MIEDAPGAIVLPATASTIEFDEVRFAYPTANEVSLASLEVVASLDERPSTEVLHGVSFRAEAGQMVALVGPSGAGKTTISQLVSRLYDVSSGVVRVGGEDVRSVTQQSLHERIGIVSQDAHMFHDTIAANLRYARPEATDEELHAALRAAQLQTLVDALPDGLQTVVGERGYRLSGGEKARLAIARLLLKRPQIVILDEATAHLDSESELAVQAALAEALHRRTSVVIAHRLSTILEADLVLVVDDGRIVQRGTHSTLLAAGGLYADLYRTQFRDAASEPSSA
jgi:ATP-binding cassette subfamily B protein